MNKKTVIIAIAIVVLGVFIFLYNKNESVQDAINNILNKDNSSDAKKAQDTVSKVTLSEEDQTYNDAREKYRTIAGDYPPASWSLNQINIWIEEWNDMNKYLSDYAGLMASMGLTSKADANIKNCTTKQEAKILYNNAVEEYAVYKEKKAAYEKLVSICTQYNISAADMGITSINNNTLAEINNAITKANELSEKATIYNRIIELCKTYGVYAADLGVTGILNNTIQELQKAETLAKQLEGLYQQYQRALFRCEALKDPISNYIGQAKWYQIDTATYASIINTVQTMYEKWCRSKGKELFNQLYANIKGNAKSFYHLATYPGQYDLDTTLAKNIADMFTKHNAESKGAMYEGFQTDGWDGGDGGTTMPRYLCDSGKGEKFPSLAAYMAFEANEKRAVSDFMCKRAGWSTWKELYNAGKKPFSD